jgi:hypothetical protein
VRDEGRGVECGLYREITNEKPDQEFIKVSDEAAKNLDKEICKHIYTGKHQRK